MVNTFLPYPDIKKSAQSLDRERLGKQRLEAYEIILLLEEYDRTGVIPTKGWSSHPAFRSWLGFTNHLKVYFNFIVREWIERGYKNNMPLYPIDETPYNIVQIFYDGSRFVYETDKINEYSFPLWVGFPPFYLSHQAALLRKNPQYYKFMYHETLIPFINVGYLWPCHMKSLESWSFSSHEKLSCGCPPIFKLKVKDAVNWMFNPNINPTTGRRIGNTSQIYKDYQEFVKEFGIIISNGYIYIRYYCKEPVPLHYLNNFEDMSPSNLILHLMN